MEGGSSGTGTSARRNNLRSGREEAEGESQRDCTPTSRPRASSAFRDPRWGRSRSCSKRRARGTWPRWRSFYPGSDSPPAPAAERPEPVEAATAAATPPLPTRSPVCSGRTGSRSWTRRFVVWGGKTLPVANKRRLLANKPPAEAAPEAPLCLSQMRTTVTCMDACWARLQPNDSKSPTSVFLLTGFLQKKNKQKKPVPIHMTHQLLPDVNSVVKV